jgi:uncharacterized protein DUF4232
VTAESRRCSSGRISLVGVIAVTAACSGSGRLDACRSNRLTPTLNALGGAASQSIWQVAIRNVSGSTCWLEGYLAADAQDGHHQNLTSSSPVRPADRRVIHLRPGKTAYSRISFAYLDPSTNKLCGPPASWLRVGLPDGKGSFDIELARPPGPGGESTTFSPCGGFVIGPIQSEPVDG